MLFYQAFRAVISLLLKLFYRLEPVNDPHHGLTLAGPVIFVGNHPNGLVDPGMVFALTARPVTFLAKAPLFKIPVLGSMLRAMEALPVFRRQDNASEMTKNEGTLTASIRALAKGGAITLFPEGKSHSEPQLAELKTGCARIALEALTQHAPVRIVPIGLNYLQKHRFRSRVRVDVGPSLDPGVFAAKAGDDPRESARKLTEAIADALRAVTLNLEKWEDLPLIQTAESLYALKVGTPARDSERIRAFAQGMRLLRDEQPARFEKLKSQVLAFAQRLSIVDAKAEELTYAYRPATVAWFVLRNLLWMVGLPFVLVGIVLFFVPYWIPILMVKLTRPDVDTEATVKVVTLLVLAPVWWAVLTGVAWVQLGWAVGLGVLTTTLPLALFTRVFLERRASALRDIRIFLVLGSRKQLKERLLAEGDAIATELESVVQELRPRIAG